MAVDSTADGGQVTDEVVEQVRQRRDESKYLPTRGVYAIVEYPPAVSGGLGAKVGFPLNG